MGKIIQKNEEDDMIDDGNFAWAAPAVQSGGLPR